jgi:hypothetical protein
MVSLKKIIDSEDNMTKQLLKRLALNFRQALLRCEKNKLPISLRTFPHGSCGDTSLLLGKYLQVNGFNGIRYICGWKDRQSHAWLLVDGFIVDITADQFSGISDGVIVTDDHTWYKQFEINTDHIADFEIYDEYTKSWMQSTYNYILINNKTSLLLG